MDESVKYLNYVVRTYNLFILVILAPIWLYMWIKGFGDADGIALAWILSFSGLVSLFNTLFVLIIYWTNLNRAIFTNYKANLIECIAFWAIFECVSGRLNSVIIDLIITYSVILCFLIGLKVRSNIKFKTRSNSNVIKQNRDMH